MWSLKNYLEVAAILSGAMILLVLSKCVPEPLAAAERGYNYRAGYNHTRPYQRRWKGHRYRHGGRIKINITQPNAAITVIIKPRAKIIRIAPRSN